MLTIAATSSPAATVIPMNHRSSSVPLAGLVAITLSSADAAVTWSTVQWFSWSTAILPSASTGSLSGEHVYVTSGGANANAPASGTSSFSVTGAETFTMNTPTLGLGAPKAGTTVTYTLDLSALTIPLSDIVFGISNLDATNSRGSITVTAVNDLNQPLNVNSWTTEAQFKSTQGLPSAQSLVTRSAVGNSMLLGTVQGGDNTSWGDSRGIFLSGLATDTKTVTFAHYYNHPNATVSDNITFFIGVVPEPSTACLAVAGAFCMTFHRRRC